MNNLKLWDSVQKTDLDFVKKAKKGAYQFTSIAPQYQFKMATVAFGQYGKHWGVVVGSEKFEKDVFGDTVILNYDAVLFYRYANSNAEFPIHSSIKYAYMTNSGNGYLKVDDDARKKVVTNAISKGLSMLGFNADVFMGMFDDDNYLYDLNNEQLVEKAANKDEELAKQAHALYADTNKVIDQIKTAQSLNEVAGLYKAMARRIGDKDKSLMLALAKAKDEAKGKFENE